MRQRRDISTVDHGKSAAKSLSKELFEYCRYGFFRKSEEGLREIIQRYALTNNDQLREIIQRHRLTPIYHLSDYDFFFEACQSIGITEGKIRCLLEYFPDAARQTSPEHLPNTIGEGGCLPLHWACHNSCATPNIIQLLIDAAPDSIHSLSNEGSMPLHNLCSVPSSSIFGVDKTAAMQIAAMQILKMLIEKYPEAVRHPNNKGNLPIHYASQWKSPEFCRVLIEAYPGSERITNANSVLPLHYACLTGSLATVEYLYKLYPDSINHAATNGYYPIHFAIRGTTKRNNPATAAKIVQFLLDCDPDVELQKHGGMCLLQFACEMNYTHYNIEEAIQIIKILFDAHPEAIEDNRSAPNIHRYHQQIQTFINEELVYARQAKDHRLMTTPDGNGRLPLHRALQNNVRLGSIKFFDPFAVQFPDSSGALPLHIACQHHDSVSVVQYLVELDTTILIALDGDGNTVLHYACRGAKYGTIALLLEKYDAASVSKTNAQGKLPVDLLWDSNEVEDRESLEYTESVFRLLKAYPAMFGQLGQWGN